MAFLDVTDVLDDPDFWSPFKVRRRGVTEGENGVAFADGAWIDTVGVIDPDAGQDLMQLGEGNAVAGGIIVYTRYPLTIGNSTTDADLVYWQGQGWTVVNAQLWAYGQQFTRAVCKSATLNTTVTGKPNDVGGYG